MKKILEGVRPFNRFWLGSCYDHAVISGAGVFGAPPEKLVLNRFTPLIQGLDTRRQTIVPEGELHRSLGFRIQRVPLEGPEQIFQQINRGCPIIVGIDNFYLSARTDNYQLYHIPHLIFVYGYDTQDGLFFVVDHRYANSFQFEEKTMPIAELAEANAQYRARLCRKRCSAMALVPCRTERVRDPERELRGDPARLERSAANLCANASFLSETIRAGATITQRIADRYNEYFLRRREDKLILRHSNVLDEKMSPVLDAADREYRFLSCLLWKMRYQHRTKVAPELVDKVKTKLEHICELERLIYAALAQGG